MLEFQPWGCRPASAAARRRKRRRRRRTPPPPPRRRRRRGRIQKGRRADINKRNLAQVRSTGCVYIYIYPRVHVCKYLYTRTGHTETIYAPRQAGLHWHWMDDGGSVLLNHFVPLRHSPHVLKEHNCRHAVCDRRQEALAVGGSTVAFTCLVASEHHMEYQNQNERVRERGEGEGEREKCCVSQAAVDILSPVRVVATETFAADARKQHIDRLCALMSLPACHTFSRTVRKGFHICVQVEGSFLPFLHMSIQNELSFPGIQLRTEAVPDPNGHLWQVGHGKHSTAGWERHRQPYVSKNKKDLAWNSLFITSTVALITFRQPSVPEQVVPTRIFCGQTPDEIETCGCQVHLRNVNLRFALRHACSRNK